MTRRPQAQRTRTRISSSGGKAYKWWQTLKVVNLEPETWAKFENMFLKEFLREKELEKN